MNLSVEKALLDLVTNPRVHIEQEDNGCDSSAEECAGERRRRSSLLHRVGSAVGLVAGGGGGGSSSSSSSGAGAAAAAAPPAATPAPTILPETTDFDHDAPAIGAEDEVANAILFFASDRARYVTGQVLSVSGGLTMSD